SALMALATRENQVACELWSMTGQELRRGQDHILVLIKSGKEGGVGFFLEIGERVRRGKHIELPMSRQDIGAYLGLAIETRPRTLADLESGASIELASARRIVLHDRGALGRLNG